ncbi:hypothetical protein GH714_035329 [Hevea brasiliensis]|uniref:S1 motif domain-containing protein n=1 Tax=Hevea brasiliensis TaxID=3981 RepID=A0A6A6KSV1_HEVBR|nr:hypothetical protein GH714_035329 [Hevea brasiliensis]
MFFHIVLERNMQLHPRYLAATFAIICGRHGFVVAITGIENIGKGLIRDGTGFVTFPVKYQCVVFRPFKGEILEAVVTMVNKMGFFAEAGPVQIFVSNHLIPDDMEFQSGDMPNYTTSDGSVKIQKDSEVRLKIIGTRVDATEIAIEIRTFLCCIGLFDITAKEGEEIHAQILRRGYEAHVHIATTLVDMYARFGCVSYARFVFNEMPVKNVVSWSAMIACYAKNGRPFEALELFREMILENQDLCPNSVTMVSVLQACAALAALEQGD